MIFSYISFWSSWEHRPVAQDLYNFHCKCSCPEGVIYIHQSSFLVAMLLCFLIVYDFFDDFKICPPTISILWFSGRIPPFCQIGEKSHKIEYKLFIFNHIYLCSKRERGSGLWLEIFRICCCYFYLKDTFIWKISFFLCSFYFVYTTLSLALHCHTFTIIIKMFNNTLKNYF